MKIPTEKELVEVICKWKYDWMNQRQNSQQDYENYYRRAFGIDANMQHSLAKRIIQEFVRCEAEATTKDEGREG